jgi:hypothetical protein
MIHAVGATFPYNLVPVLATELQKIDADVVVNQRPLDPLDNVQAIGIYPTKVEDQEDSMEIGRRFGPTVERWVYGIQALVKDADAVRGAADQGELVSRIEDILYNSQPLRLALGTTTALSTSGVIRRVTRKGVRSRNYLQGGLAGEFYFLATLEFWLETEKS